jgi:RNA polymerase sigma factor (sigma-70 family)
MDSSSSVTNWIKKLQEGDRAGIEKLWQRYFPQLVSLARHKLHAHPRRMADEEDVAASAFKSFCRRAEEGKLPTLHNRDDLWGILVVLTAGKAIDLVRRETAQKRGGRAPEGDGALSPAGQEPDLAEIIGREPTPEFAAEVAEEFQRLLGCLPTRELKTVALLKMEGYTNEEIAVELECVTRTIERKLQVIRRLWTESDPPR